MKNKTVIIAEAGVNHQGSIKLAKKMIKEAANAKCNFIKFQVFKADNLVTIKAKKANYQKKFLPNETQYTMLKRLEFDFKTLKELKRISEKTKIDFLCSGFDIEDLKVIKKLNLKILKIPSGEINNLPYLRYAGKNFNKIIISTGLSKLSEIKFAVQTLYKSGLEKKNLTILHCVSSYPAPQNETNLSSINYLKRIFKCKTGFSDHSEGIKIPVLAVSVGAEVIEKHFTLNRKMKGPDHKASLNAVELKKMVQNIRNIEKIMGSFNKIMSISEKKNKFYVRKSIVAKKNIQKGEKFSVGNISCKRPANGISPEFWDKVVGKKANKNYSKDQIIKI